MLASAYWDYARKAVVSQSVTAPFLLSEQEQQAAADMLACYQSVPWLFRAVQMRCDAVSKMPFRITKKGSTSKDAFDDSANYQNKLGFLPNPTRLFWLIEAASSFWGSAYLWRSYNERRVLGLRYLLPPTITPEIDEDQGLTGFTRYLNGQPKHSTTADIVYLWRPDPFVEIGPPLSSPVSAALSAANVLLNVDLFAAAFFQRGAIKATLLTVEGNPPKTEREALKTWWERVIGGIRNAFSTEVVSANVTPVQIGEGINDLANTTLTDEKRSEIAVALGVPQSVIHSGSATGLGGGGVARQDDKHFYDKTVVPECGWMQADLNEQVFHPQGYHMEFTPEVLEIYQAEEAALARSFQLYVDIGLPKSLAAQMVGIELPPGWEYADLDKMEAPEGKDAAGKDAADDEKRKEEQADREAERDALEGAGKPTNDDAKALPDDDDGDAAKGGAGSGNWGHEGRPGVRGGSKPGGGAMTVVSTSEISIGVNTSTLVTYSDGTKAVWKPMDGDAGFHDGNSEIAAYRLSQILGANVPETKIEQINGQEGTSQRYIDGLLGAEAGKQGSGSDAIIALDVIMENPDRHASNWMVNRSGETVAIDNGHAGWGLWESGNGSVARRNSLLGRQENGTYQFDNKNVDRWRSITREQFDKAFTGLRIQHTVTEQHVSRARANRGQVIERKRVVGNIQPDNAWRNLQYIIANGSISW